MYDSNGDGHIDFREFMIVLYIMSNGTPEENLKQVKVNTNIFCNWKIYNIFSIKSVCTLEKVLKTNSKFDIICIWSNTKVSNQEVYSMFNQVLFCCQFVLLLTKIGF